MRSKKLVSQRRAALRGAVLTGAAACAVVLLAARPALAYFDAYDGFTWYQNSVGSMIPTRYGATFLLAGKFPQVGDAFADYRAQPYDRSTFLNDLGSLGFSAAVYSDESVAWDEHSMAYLASHTVNVHPVGEDARAAVDPVGSLQVLYKAACYRDLPWPAKPFFWFSTEEINNGMTVRSAGADFASKPYVMDDAKYMAELQQTGVSATDTGVNGSFRFIHLMGSHPPYTLYRDGTRVAAGTYPEDQSVGAINIVATYLQKLTGAGVYDQATVIVTADHGE